MTSQIIVEGISRLSARESNLLPNAEVPLNLRAMKPSRVSVRKEMIIPMARGTGHFSRARPHRTGSRSNRNAVSRFGIVFRYSRIAGCPHTAAASAVQADPRAQGGGRE